MKHQVNRFNIPGAILGTVLMAGSAQAALVNFNVGDLLLGFRDVTGTQSVVVDIGSAASYRDDTLGYTPTQGVTLSLGDINTDLVAAFGPGWATNPNMRWGIAGSPSNVAAVGGDTAKTVYASKPETNGSVGSGLALSNTNRGIVSTTMMGLEGSTNGFSTYQASLNNPALVIQANTDAASWRSFQLGGTNSTSSTAFKQINGGIEGTLAQPLDLFRTDTANTSSYLGTLSIDAGGAVTVIPEPSSLLIASLGLGSLMLRRRRNQA
ncbi:MAG: PEP-CTERM sorting domain-containing protein [Verrucomicrobiota bacterium]